MVVFIPMIFNGGMISSYVVNTQLLNLKNRDVLDVRASLKVVLQVEQGKGPSL